MYSAEIDTMAYEILSELRPTMEGKDTGIILAALAEVMTRVAMVGLDCEQATAIAFVASLFNDVTEDTSH